MRFHINLCYRGLVVSINAIHLFILVIVNHSLNFLIASFLCFVVGGWWLSIPHYRTRKGVGQLYILSNYSNPMPIRSSRMCLTCWNDWALCWWWTGKLPQREKNIPACVWTWTNWLHLWNWTNHRAFTRHQNFHTDSCKFGYANSP